MTERGRQGCGGLVALLLLAGCASGPEHGVPPSDLSSAYLQPAAAASAESPSIAEFWRGFGDAVLDRLVGTALAANLDVQLARSRLREAMALQQGVEADRLPNLAVDGSATRSQAPQWQQPGRSRGERTGNVFAVSGLMNWELDLFGRQQREVEAASALVAAGRYGVATAQAAVVAQVAGDYFALRGIDQRLAVAEASLRAQRESLRLAQARLDAGRGTAFDLARTRGLVASTAASLPALSAQRERLVHRLATLTGQPATDVLQAVAVPGLAVLPGLAATDLSALPLGTPEALLSRRADIRAAERQLAAASAEIGVAIADRYPRISFSGLLGLSDPRLSGLGRGSAATASVGAALSWSAWDFGRNDARVSGAEQRHATARLRYRQTVLNALQETETALSAYTRGVQQAAELTVAAGQNEDAARIARLRYAAGSSDLLAVLDAERQALAAQDQLVQARAATAGALVEVYRALGGGWPPPT